MLHDGDDSLVDSQGRIRPWIERHAFGAGRLPAIFAFNRVAKKMRTGFEMGTDGHRFLCFQFGIS